MYTFTLKKRESVSQQTNKRKIVNDPLYGFINISSDLIFDLIEHPYFQRLRRIRQLGLTNFVYPGANHTRFQHALGAMYLMDEAISILRSKGQAISDDEAEAVRIAILLHDIGHGPFSHALEFSIIDNFTHEQLSLELMKALNNEFHGKLELAIKIFNNEYSKKFLHQLVSGHLDMDRLDYLKRDSFFTGVTEGVIGSDRIIKMLNVVNDELVVDAKGIYSIEKFLIARRLMYWQVYLHKTVLAAENQLILLLKRAKQLSLEGVELFATPPLLFFLKNKPNNDLTNIPNLDKPILDQFNLLDDTDIIASMKVWIQHPDKVLSFLATSLTHRELFKVEIQSNEFDYAKIEYIRKKACEYYQISVEESKFFVFSDSVSNNTYIPTNDNQIKIRYNNGSITDIAEASDMLNISVLSKVIEKHFLCYPKILKTLI